MAFVGRGPRKEGGIGRKGGIGSVKGKFSKCVVLPQPRVNLNHSGVTENFATDFSYSNIFTPILFSLSVVK